MEKQPHVPTIDEMIELPVLLDPQISPDGSHVAYVVSTPDWEENAHVSQLWLVQVEGGKPRQLTFAQQSSSFPRWSPDSQWLAFLSKREGDEHDQIYRMSPFGGEAERLTELETDVQTLFWSPEGRSIAYIAAAPESEVDQQRQEKYGDYHVEDKDYERAQLWQLHLEDKKSRNLAGGEDVHVADVDWHPRGDRIAFEGWPTPDIQDVERSRIYLLDVETLALDPLTEEGCSTPRWSPDGEQIALTRRDEHYYNNNELGLMPAAGGPIRIISKAFDGTIELQDWGTDGLYFWAIQGSSIHLFLMDPENGDYRRLTPEEPAGWASMQHSFGPDLIALVGGDVEHYFEVTVLDPAEGAIRRLTDYNDRLRDWQLGQQELFHWASSDGTPIEGVLIRPADFDPEKRYPLLVVIHGGPSWISMLARLAGGERRYYPMQQWVAKGALILMPNYRGSAGYGEAFRALNVRNLGLGDYEDVISGVDALIERGWIDPERVGAMGWSQGGYISAFITTYSDRFQAVSVGAGISNWVTYYVNTDIHPFTRHYMDATPWQDMDIYRQTSPMTYIRQAQTPTLIQHGEFDRRVPIPNAYELYQGLQDVGVEVKLVVYKDMPHGITKPRLNRQVMQENLDWFNRWIWGEEPEPEDPAPCYVVIGDEENRTAEGERPALERYPSTPVQDVYHWARRDRASFRIFSARFGLLEADQLTPPGEQRLQAEDVSALAAQLAEQIKTQKLQKLALYTAEAKEQPWVLVYLGCLQVAAGLVGGVTVEHHPVSEKGWQPPEDE